jgi:hypothetical protein
MRPTTFGRSFLPELREILLSMGETTYYGPDGEPTQVRDEPFLEQWQLRSLGYVLLQEQIIGRNPDTVPDHVRIQSPANRPRRDARDSNAQAPSSDWWAMRGE